MYVEPADSPNTGEWNVGLYTNYAFHPVTLTDDGTGARYQVISNQLTGDLVAGVGLWHRVFVGVDVPFLLFQTGDAMPASVTAAAGDLTVPSQSLGDVALDFKTTLLRPTAGELGGLAFALTERLTLPTGDDQSFLGEGTPTSETRLLGEFRVVGVAVHGALGVKLRGDEAPFACALFEDPRHPEACPTRFGHEIPFGLGLSVKPQMFGVDKKGRLTVFLETHGYVPLAPVHPFQSEALSEWQLSLASRVAFGDVSVLGGVEHALLHGIGNPDFRATLAVSWAPRLHDRDGDGIPDDVDQCPDLPEDFDGFQDADGCPDGDNDDDGVPDVDDACPNQAGPENPDPKKNGCPVAKSAAAAPPTKPLDADGDGIPDADDACPKEPGPRDPDPKKNGCPKQDLSKIDSDKDTFPDSVDKCPSEPEDFNGFEDEDGCPDAQKPGAKKAKPLVVVKDKKGAVTLELARKIAFDKAGEVDAASVVLVRAVAAELLKHEGWRMSVGVRPKPNESTADVEKRARAVAALLHKLAPGTQPAATAPWAAVKSAPRAEEFGVGFSVQPKP
jgi:hypothetical protein